VLRRDLVRDYFPFRDALAAARGEIEALASAEEYYGGNLRLVCAYEEFGADTEPNRVLKAAAQAVMASVDAAPRTRQRARRVTTRMEDVGALQTNDLRTQTDRRTAHYRDALLLARAILLNIRRTLAHGDEPAWTFLIRTPEVVEAGVRAELRERLPEAWNVRKVTFPLRGANMTVAPDLVFGDVIAVGDVKYKRVLPRWRRADLYEVTAFATAAGAPRAAVIGFRGASDPDPPRTVGVGDTDVRFFAWEAHDDVSPEEAAAALAVTIRDWLAPLGERSPEPPALRAVQRM
jgi:5-methylcytosine-specific restriction enzyme subunit McrC